MSLKLYEIDTALEDIWDEIEIAIEEDDFDHLEKLEKHLEGLELSLNDKLINYARIIKAKKVESAALREEEKKLAARRKTIENQIEWLSGGIKANLPKGSKIKDATCTISTRKTERLELLVDPEDLPREFTRIKIEADKTLLKERCKDNAFGKGCEYASIREDYSITIK